MPLLPPKLVPLLLLALLALAGQGAAVRVGDNAPLVVPLAVPLAPAATRRQSYEGRGGLNGVASLGPSLPISHQSQLHVHSQPLARISVGETNDEHDHHQQEHGDERNDSTEQGSKDPAEYSFGYSVQVRVRGQVPNTNLENCTAFF